MMILNHTSAISGPEVANAHWTTMIRAHLKRQTLLSIAYSS